MNLNFSTSALLFTGKKGVTMPMENSLYRLLLSRLPKIKLRHTDCGFLYVLYLYTFLSSIVTVGVKTVGID
jgi:hypothetical protein